MFQNATECNKSARARLRARSQERAFTTGLTQHAGNNFFKVNYSFKKQFL